MAFLQLVNMIQGPSLGLAQLVPGVISSFTSVERLEELETLQVEALEGHCLFKEVEKIEFMQVSFMYETSRPLLDHLNWVFQCGKIYALTGKTGCGKTTVFRLLLAFIKPVGGRYASAQMGGAWRQGRIHALILLMSPRIMRLFPVPSRII